MKFKPCAEGSAFIYKHRTLEAAWKACQKPGWMIWSLSRLGMWNETLARQFSILCASHTLHIFEDVYPNDKRPRLAIRAAKNYLKGRINDSKLNAARSAAWSAARGAAESAAWSAARGAAESAAESAAWSAARGAAESAAESAVWSAVWIAPWSAPESATESAARVAAESAAQKESKWQADALRTLINPFATHKK
jgi:Immunity protein Imm5